MVARNKGLRVRDRIAELYFDEFLWPVEISERLECSGSLVRRVLRGHMTSVVVTRGSVPNDDGVSEWARRDRFDTRYLSGALDEGRIPDGVQFRIKVPRGNPFCASVRERHLFRHDSKRWLINSYYRMWVWSLSRPPTFKRCDTSECELLMGRKYSGPSGHWWTLEAALAGPPIQVVISRSGGSLTLPAVLFKEWFTPATGSPPVAV